MAEESWDKRVKDFLVKTGEDLRTETRKLFEEIKDPERQQRLKDGLKQAGESIKAETQRLIEEVRDPVRARKVKESLQEIGTWAKKTAEEAAQIVESAVRKAEGGHKANGASTPRPTPSDVRAPPASPSDRTAGKKAGAVKKKPASKTIGRKKG